MKALLTALFLVTCLTLTACGSDDDGGNGDVCEPQADGTVALYDECCDETGAECSTGLCFTYGNGEQRCSKTCQNNDECEAPSPGCSGMGVCQRPGG